MRTVGICTLTVLVALGCGDGGESGEPGGGQRTEGPPIIVGDTPEAILAPKTIAEPDLERCRELGLALAAASRRALERAEQIPARSYYFDLLEFERRAPEFQTTNTPAWWPEVIHIFSPFKVKSSPLRLPVAAGHIS